MDLLIRYALPAVILTTGLGAFLTCVLVLRFGLTSAGEEPEEDARSLRALRLGHVLAAVIFAMATLFGVVAAGTRLPPAPRIAGSRPAPEGPASPPAGDRTVSAPAPSVMAPAVPPPSEGARAAEGGPPPPSPRSTAATAPRPALSLPPADLDEARLSPDLGLPGRHPLMEGGAPGLPPPAPEAGADAPATSGASALPAPVARERLRTTIQGVRVDVERREGGGESVYVIRLTDTGGRPLDSADVSLHGRLPDGTAFAPSLEPSGEAGVLVARVPAGANGPRDLRLRVAQRHRRFEVALSHSVSWD
jgi:hypothetical protein